MSEVVLGGVAATAVAACAAAAGAVVGAGYLAWRALGWLSDRAKAELERLDAELGEPVTHASAVEARAAFKRYQALARASAMKHPALRGHATLVARLVAARKSAAAAFLTEHEWHRLARPDTAERTVAALLDQATRRMARANAAYVSRGIAAAAAEAGFTAVPRIHHRSGRQTLVIHDPQGRAFVAEVVESDAGARVTLDLTGFGDASCHAVMDRVLQGLEAGQVRLAEARRRSHYRRDGYLASSQGSRTDAGRPLPGPGTSPEAHARRRRGHFHATERARLSQ